MAGLLYKDYVSVFRIKKINAVVCLIIFTVVFLGARILLRGNEAEVYDIYGNNTAVSVIDILFVSYYVLLQFAFAIILNQINIKIIECDTKNKIKEYIGGLPVSKNTYVASKYIFIAIVCYVMISVSYLYGIIISAYCLPGMACDFCDLGMANTITLACIFLMVSSVELPLYLMLGKEKSNLFKTGFWMIVAFCGIGLLLFGDGAWIEEHINLANIVEWYKNHTNVILILQMISPVIVLGIYYLSYRVSCRLISKKEW